MYWNKEKQSLQQQSSLNNHLHYELIVFQYKVEEV